MEADPAEPYRRSEAEEGGFCRFGDPVHRPRVAGDPNPRGLVWTLTPGLQVVRRRADGQVVQPAPVGAEDQRRDHHAHQQRPHHRRDQR